MLPVNRAAQCYCWRMTLTPSGDFLTRDLRASHTVGNREGNGCRSEPVLETHVFAKKMKSQCSSQQCCWHRDGPAGVSRGKGTMPGSAALRQDWRSLL